MPPSHPRHGSTGNGRSSQVILVDGLVVENLYRFLAGWKLLGLLSLDGGYRCPGLLGWAWEIGGDEVEMISQKSDCTECHTALEQTQRKGTSRAVTWWCLFPCHLHVPNMEVQATEGVSAVAALLSAVQPELCVPSSFLGRRRFFLSSSEICLSFIIF